MNTAEDLYVEEFEENDLNTFEETENQNQENIEVIPVENDEEENESAKKQQVKAKRVIRNPQPRLNAQTLRGKRGLTAVESYFDRVKYKGRGHEEQDLSVILKTYEYWCHRLFPKYPFDECISKIEKLGTKRPVVTQIKKIRADLLDDDEPINDAENSGAVADVSNDQIDEQVSNNQFDEVSNNHFDNLFDTPLSQPTVELSEEQMEQIRLNKERAEKIREEKLRKKRELAASSVTVNENNSEYSIEEMSQTEITQSQEMAESSVGATEDNTECFVEEILQTESVKLPELAVPSFSSNNSEYLIEEIPQTEPQQLQTLTELSTAGSEDGTEYSIEEISQSETPPLP